MISIIRQLPLVAFVVIGSSAAVAHAAPVAVDPLGCSETVHDVDGVLDLAELNPEIARTAAFLDADLRIRVEPTLDGGIDQRIDQLRRQCDGWDRDGQLADDMVVVMFSPTERENGIYYGDSSVNAPDVAWDEATDAMIPYLRDGDYTEAVDAALRELREAPSVSSSGSTSEEDDGGNGSLVLIIVVVIAAVAIWLASKMRRMASGEGGLFESSGDGFDGGDGGQGWLSSSSSRRRRRSSFGFGGSRRSGSSSRSRRSGSRRRAGGGSKKW